jgi:hypothetical protein
MTERRELSLTKVVGYQVCQVVVTNVGRGSRQIEYKQVAGEPAHYFDFRDEASERGAKNQASSRVGKLEAESRKHAEERGERNGYTYRVEAIIEREKVY